MKFKLKSRKTAIVVALAWGLLLAVGGVINGNQAFTAPDMEHVHAEVMKEKIDAHSLNCWITNHRTDYRIIEFAKTNQCSPQFSGLSTYSCINEAALRNKKWLRNAFRSSNRQLIVFGATPDKSLEAAANLKLHGYAVRMLDQSENFEIKPASESPVQSIVQPVQQAVAPTVAQPASSGNNVTMAAEEEEGC